MNAFKDYDAALHRYLTRRLSSAEGARDLAQEAYLRLFRVPHPELVKAPQAYLFRIASNLVYERANRNRLSVVTFDSRFVECVGDVEMVDDGERVDTERLLRAMLSRLPPLQAAILVMKKRDGRSYREIARELGVSVHTVKKYLCLAVARCRAVGERLDGA